MTAPDAETMRERIDAIYRGEGRAAFATLVRLLGDFDRAEEALQDALRVALERWPVDGLPTNPAAWLVATGRFQAIDRLRRARRFRDWDAATEASAAAPADGDPLLPAALHDDRLRLIFTCCHPALAEDVRLALTLREVCGLTTEAIASAFVLTPSTLAQRIVRAKSKIRSAGIPFEVPEPEQLAERLGSVLRVAYLVFNEGYSASSGAALLRVDLADEAIRLCRLLHGMLPEPEVEGLLALMLLQQSRRTARVDVHGDLVPLDAQDRSRWDRNQIVEGCALVEHALGSGRAGPYALQAAIAAVHAEAVTASDTDWPQIVGLYEVLLRLDPNPVIALNRAVAVAMRDGPEAGLTLIARLFEDGRLDRYHLLHAARGELLRRTGDRTAARTAFARAAELAQQQPEQRFLLRRLGELDDPSVAPG